MLHFILGIVVGALATEVYNLLKNAGIIKK